MIRVFLNRWANRKKNRMPYSFALAPLVAGLIAMGFGLWALWEVEEPLSKAPIPGGYLKGMALSAGFVIGGIIGLMYTWNVNRQGHDEDGL